MTLADASRGRKRRCLHRWQSSPPGQHGNKTFQFFVSPNNEAIWKIIAIERSLANTLHLPLYNQNLQWGLVKSFIATCIFLSGMRNYRMAHALMRCLPYLAIMTPEKKRGLQIFDSFIDFFSSANTDRRCTYRVNKIQKMCWPIVCTAFESSKAALRSVNLKKTVLAHT